MSWPKPKANIRIKIGFLVILLVEILKIFLGFGVAGYGII